MINDDDNNDDHNFDHHPDCKTFWTKKMFYSLGYYN